MDLFEGEKISKKNLIEELEQRGDITDSLKKKIMNMGEEITLVRGEIDHHFLDNHICFLSDA